MMISRYKASGGKVRTYHSARIWPMNEVSSMIASFERVGRSILQPFGFTENVLPNNS